MTNGLGMTGAYTYAKATDWWAGGILIPEYWYLNKGTQRGNNRHKVDISATYELPFGEGRKYANNPGALSTVVSDWQVNTYFTTFTGSPFTVTAAAASLNANSPQVADQVKSDVEIIGRRRAERDSMVRRDGLQAGHRGAFGTAGFNTLRGPGYANLDLSIFRTFPVKQSINVQFRLEIFNLTNTAHFVNPSASIQNVAHNADGSIRALNGFGSITGTNNVGREYDERYMRIERG